MQAVCQSHFELIAYLKIVHCSWNSAFPDLPKRKEKISLQNTYLGRCNPYLVTVDMKDRNYSPAFSWVDELNRFSR